MKLRSEIIEKIAVLITAAFGLVAALAREEYYLIIGLNL